MTEVSAGTLTDFLLARIADARRQLQPAECDCLIPGMPFEHGARCPVLLLAECEAQREIVCFFDSWLIPDNPFARLNPSMPTMAREMLEALALPHADHPDYREEWRP